MTRPPKPPASAIWRTRRGGRAVTTTVVSPAALTRARTARVRSDTVPSVRSSVPSRWAAIRRNGIVSESARLPLVPPGRRLWRLRGQAEAGEREAVAEVRELHLDAQ